MQTVPHEELIIRSSEDGCRDVDQDRDPRVAVVDAESLTTKEDSCDNTGTKIPGQIGRECIACETPYHRGVNQTDGEGNALRGHEWIGRVQACPDEDTDVTVNKEFLEEEEACRLTCVGVRAEDTGNTTVVVNSAMEVEVDGFGGLDFRPIAAHEEESGHEGAKDLAEDVVRHFFPGETLPDG